MSYKSALSNSLKSNCDTPQWIPKTESNVKLAGEEAKDRLYEPKHKKKLVRVLTVVAYIFFVSLAAIMLSLYYVFLYPQNWQKFKDPEMAAPGQARYNGNFTSFIVCLDWFRLFSFCGIIKQHVNNFPYTLKINNFVI